MTNKPLGSGLGTIIGLSVVVGMLATLFLTFILVVISKKLYVSKDTKAMDNGGILLCIVLIVEFVVTIFYSDPQTSHNPAYEIVTLNS